MELTEDIVRTTYSKLKGKAINLLKKGNVGRALKFAHLAAYTSNSFWLSYHDEDIEGIFKDASKYIHQKNSSLKGTYDNRCVMLDSLSRYRGGLSLQFIDAIVNAEWELLYITNQDMKSPHCIELLNYMSQYPNIRIVMIPRNLSYIKKLQYAYDQVISFSPKRVYVHIKSSDSFFPSLIYALPSAIQKFYIDIADHAFRSGINACDYCFEFRSLGCSILTQHKGIAKEQILMLPFYPIIDNRAYEGLPPQCKEKKIILSGGSFWKIIDLDDTFFKLSKRILDENRDAIILFPGSGNPNAVRKKCIEYGIEDRFILLGWRYDIAELFRHSTIFLNTFPHTGGTMSLYAAHTHIPILSYSPSATYHPNPVESFICQKKDVVISSRGEVDFICEANKLLHDDVYRREKADKAYNCVMNKESFNELFKELSIKHKNVIPFHYQDDTEILHERVQKKIQYHNTCGEYQTRLISISGLNSITFNPVFIIPFFKNVLPKIMRVYKERQGHINRI